MSGRIPLGPNEPTVNDLLYQASVIAGDGSPALAVVNTDGTSVDSISSAIGISGTAAPSKVVQIGASDGANLHTILVDNFGNLWANIRTALPAGTNSIGAVQQATTSTAVAVSASATVVKNSSGYLSGVIVSVAGTSQALTIYDNASAASGKVIGVVPSGATAGQYYPFNMPAANGITCSGNSNNPAITVAYS